MFQLFTRLQHRRVFVYVAIFVAGAVLGYYACAALTDCPFFNPGKVQAAAEGGAPEQGIAAVADAHVHVDGAAVGEAHVDAPVIGNAGDAQLNDAAVDEAQIDAQVNGVAADDAQVNGVAADEAQVNGVAADDAQQV